MNKLLTFEEYVWENYPFVTKQFEKYLEENRPQEFSPWDRFWNGYGKKVGTAKCKSAFKRIPKSKLEKVIEHAIRYAEATPDKKFRMNPLTYLNGKFYEDEETITAAIERNRKTNRSSASVEQAGENLKKWFERFDNPEK